MYTCDDLRIAMLDTGEIFEVHTKVSLILISNCCSYVAIITYRKKGQRQVEARYESKLFHAFILISTCREAG